MFSLHALVDATCEESFTVLSYALTAAGVRPIRMAGAEGLARLVNRVKVSAVFIDWDVSHGHRGVRIVRESPSNQNVPITMITASNSTSVISDAAREGVSFFLTKPLNIENVTRVLRQQLAYMHDERRSYQRLPLSLPVACTWEDEGERQGKSVNISASGMLLELAPPPPIGTQLELNFGGQDLEREFNVRGEVVRSGPNERIGVRYIWDSLGQHEELKDCLDHKLDELAVA